MTHWSEIAGDAPLNRGKEDEAVQARAIAELSIVRLCKPVETEEGTVPAGSRGTVVHAYDDGQAYMIEFYEPFHTVATVEGDAIAA